MTIRHVPGLYHGDGGRLQESIDNKILKLGFKRADEDGGIAPDDLDDVVLFRGIDNGISCLKKFSPLVQVVSQAASVVLIVLKFRDN